MKKYIKWTFVNEYGKQIETIHYEWFQDEDTMKAWYEMMVRENGGYFKVLTIKDGNYEEYLHMLELEKELAVLKEKF